MTKERISAIPYTTYTQKESKIIPGLIIDGDELLTCPRCKYVTTMPNHSEKITCRKCELNIQVWGASLEITQ